MVEVDEVNEGQIFGFHDRMLKFFKGGIVMENIENYELFIPNNNTLIDVKIEPVNIEEKDKLINGLKILSKIDPVCVIIVDDQG